MSTFNLPAPNESVRVSISDTNSKPLITESELLSFPAFKTWLSTVSHSLSLQSTTSSHPFHESPYKLRSLEIQSVDRFGGSRLGFIKLKAEVKNDTGESLPGSIFLRGGAVAMLVVLRVRDTQERYVLLTRQARVPAGSLDMIELPAGMIDDSGSFAGAAAKEIEEELGMEIPENELVDLTKLAAERAQEEGHGERLQDAFYTSPGGSDEFMVVFMHEKVVQRETIDEWKGRLTGLREHGEKITLKVVRLEDLWWKGRLDSKALAAVALYEGLRREGKIK